MSTKKLKICFAASTGGHFEQLMMLKPLMEQHDSFILTEKTDYKTSVGQYPVFYMTQVNRREILFIPKMLINTVKSIGLYIKQKPDVIICTGVLAMIPMCLFMKLMRKKLIFIESFAKVSSPTLSGKLLYKYADRFYVQWEEMLQFYPDAIYKGGIY